MDRILIHEDISFQDHYKINTNMKEISVSEAIKLKLMNAIMIKYLKEIKHHFLRLLN